MCYFSPSFNFLFYKEILWQKIILQSESLIILPLRICTWCFSHKQVVLTFFPFESAESKTNLANKMQRKKYYEYSKQGIKNAR